MTARIFFKLIFAVFCLLAVAMTSADFLASRIAKTRVRGDFVIHVSHELRTPLASIQGYTETLMDGALRDRWNTSVCPIWSTFTRD